MRTNFTSEQLDSPEIAEANQILQTCVHYGFCTNTCPTYVLTRDENESPRGRIDLIRSMLEDGGSPSASTVRHLDSCLSCLSCMTTCAAKVDYIHLIDHARIHIERHYRRPWADRLLRAVLAYLLPDPNRFRAALGVGRAAKRLSAVAPSMVRPLLEMVPGRVATEILRPQIFRAEGRAEHRVALLAGCVQQVLNRDINAATIRLLQRHGCDVVVVEEAGCCGSLALHMGKESQARFAAAKNVRAWSREIASHGLDAIVVNASGCGTTIKDYGHLFSRDDQLSGAAKQVSKLAVDVTEFISKIGLRESVGTLQYRVAYHDPCSMQHGQKLTRPPRDLLKAAGFQVLDVPEKHFCCGSAGTYNLLQPEMARRLGQRKADHIRSTDPDILATGNIGCMTQLAQFLQTPIIHTVELLDWATGGPLPPTLKDRILRDPINIPISTSEADTSIKTAPSSDDAGFW